MVRVGTIQLLQQKFIRSAFNKIMRVLTRPPATNRFSIEIIWRVPSGKQGLGTSLRRARRTEIAKESLVQRRDIGGGALVHMDNPN